jgi:flagellar FliL protein
MSEAPAAAPQTSGAKSLVGMVIAAAFMGAVVAAECLIAWLMIPSVDEVVAQAEHRIQERAPKSHDPVDHLDPEHEHEETVEVDLGAHSFTSYVPARGTNLRIDFHLYGIVSHEEHTEFEHLYHPVANRLRESVLVVIRNADVADLTEANLGLIKRRILEKSNRLLGKNLLRDLVVTDFTFVEQ